MDELQRTSGGQFAPGQCGNSNGRPKGSPNKATIYKEYLVPRSQELVERGLEMALAAGEGCKENTIMLKLFLERILPKPGDSVLNLGIIAGSFNEKSRRIFENMSDGEVAVSDGAELIKALATTQSVNLEDLESRERRLQEIHTTVMAIQKENKELKEKIRLLEGVK